MKQQEDHVLDKDSLERIKSAVLLESLIVYASCESRWGCTVGERGKNQFWFPVSWRKKAGPDYCAVAKARIV